MKFGFRKPSWKKSLSAATRGAVNRAVKKAIIPGYGEKGMGVLNPKKYLYNKLYNVTTIDTIGLLTRRGHCSGKNTYSNLNNAISNPDVDFCQAQELIDLRKEGLKQCQVVFDLVSFANDVSFESEAIKKIQGRASKYLNKGTMCGEDFYQFSKCDFEKLIETAVRVSTINESRVAILIIDQLRKKESFNDIITNVKIAYSKLETTKAVVKKYLPNELLNNSNGHNEAVEQQKSLMEFIKYTESKKYGLQVLGARVKMLDLCVKRLPEGVNLFDFMLFMLGEQIDNVKRDKTKDQYRIAYKMIEMLNMGGSNEEISTWLDSIGR